MDEGFKVESPYETAVYHATVNLDGVCNLGLRTDEELRGLKIEGKLKWGSTPTGIGGAGSVWISTTANPEKARDFVTDLKTIVRIAKGDFDFDTIKDHLNKVDHKKDMILRPSDLWTKIEYNPEKVCLNARKDQWGRDFNFDAEEIKNLKNDIVKKDLGHYTDYTRRQWQYQYPKKEGYPEVIFPKKEDGETDYAYVKSTNKEELAEAQRKMIFDIFTKCYSPVRPRYGGAVDMSQINDNLNELSQINLHNIGVVKATAIIPRPYDELRRLVNYHYIGDEDDWDDPEKKKAIKEWDEIMDNQVGFSMHARGWRGDWNFEEVRLRSYRLKDLYIVDIEEK